MRSVYPHVLSLSCALRGGVRQPQPERRKPGSPSALNGAPGGTTPSAEGDEDLGFTTSLFLRSASLRFLFPLAMRPAFIFYLQHKADQ